MPPADTKSEWSEPPPADRKRAAKLVPWKPRSPLRLFGVRMFQRFARGLVKIFAPIRVTGVENVPRTGPLIFAPHHLCDADPPAVGTIITERPPYFMAKEELFRVPILANLLRAVGSFPVRRGAPDRSALRYAEEILKHGETVVIFPGGRTSPTGALLPIQPGIAMVALRSGAPVVVMGVTNTNKVMPYGKLIPRFSRSTPIRIHFAEPIAFEDLRTGAIRREQIDECCRRIAVALAAAQSVAEGRPVKPHPANFTGASERLSDGE
jgi:1-acyl-sn-glycerol-3-phosphate acyltransferase